MIAIALKFLATPFGRKAAATLAVAVAIVALLAEVRHSGANAVRKDDAKKQAVAIAQTAKTNTETQALATSAGSDAKASQALIVYRTKTVIQRVPYEIPLSAMLPVGFGRLYDASLGLPDNAGTPPGAGDQTGSIHAADALPIIAGNNGECLADRDRLSRLQDLYTAVRAKVNAKR